MKRAALYSRVSTIEQEKTGYSLQAQREKMEQFANMKDYTIADHYSDGGHSGSNIDRPDMQRLLSDIKSGKIDVVVVYKLDRLSRSQKNTLYLIEDVFLKHDVDFVSLQENIDTNSAFGKAMIGILSVFAQLELNTITERFMMGRIERAKKGYWKGSGNVPFGYDYTDGELILNQDYEIVQEIFDRYTSGVGAYEIYKDLLSRYPDKIYSANMITRILDNITYTGQVKFDGETYQGIHDPIISLDTFELAQEMRSNPEDRFKVDRTKRAALLARKIVCGRCNSSVSMFRHYYVKNGTRAEYGYYRCNSKRNRSKLHRSINCDQQNKRTDEIDTQVIDTINQINFDTEVKRIATKRAATPGQHDIDELEKQEKRLLDLYQFGTIESDELNSRLSDIQLKKRRIHESKQSKKEKKALNIIKSVQDTDIHTMTFEEQCDVIDSLVKKVVLTGDNISLEFNF